jgi:MFS family permease
MTTMLRWYKELSGKEQRTFWACFGGWSLDAMDAQMFSFLIPALMAAFDLSRGKVGLLGTAALIAAGLGGWGSGLLSDRFGRVKVLQFTILWFAFFTLIAGFAQSYHQLLVIRILQGIGFGGEWGAGAVLMGEIIRPEHRGKAVGCVQSGYGVGWAAATILSTAAFIWLPKEYAWRALLWVGVVPAVLVIFMRRLIEEPEVFRQVRAIEDATGNKPGVFAIFQPAILRTTILSAFLALGVIGAGSAINPWLPSLLKTVHHLSVGRVGLYMAVVTIGAFFGFIGGAYLTDRLGRRPNLLLFAICSWLLTLAYMYLPLSNTALLFLGLPFGFFTVGIYGSLGPYFTELFPTFVRGSGQAFAYNFGKSFGAFSVAAVGLIATHMTLGASIGLVSLGCYSLSIVATLLLPETRGLELTAEGLPNHMTGQNFMKNYAVVAESVAEKAHL